MPTLYRLIRTLALAGVLLGLCVVVLGAYVRLSAAGLGCPDWPGCYGKMTPAAAAQSPAAQAAYPNRPLEEGKAWREMIHRYAAGTLALIIVGIAVLAVALRQTRIIAPAYAFALVGIVVFQALLGMLTVTWLLKPLIVTLHLLFGLTTLGLMWWLFLSLPRSPARADVVGAGSPDAIASGTSGAARRTSGAAQRSSGGSRGASGAAQGARALVVLALCLLGVQIALGGWTSSNYAAVACPDFPKCQNAWWPSTDYANAFLLWRGQNINFEGGVLENPARVAIHLTHRIGALVAAIALLAAAIASLVRARRPVTRIAAGAVLGALALQLSIGITMVLRGFPLWLATAHNAGAALLLLATLALAWSWRRSAQSRAF